MTPTLMPYSVSGAARSIRADLAPGVAGTAEFHEEDTRLAPEPARHAMVT